MSTLRSAGPPRNQIAEAIARIAVDVLEILTSDPTTIAKLRTLASQEPEAGPQADAGLLLSKAALARKLSVSVATIDRLTREGMPLAAHVGDSRRFDIEACRAWLATRGKRPTKSPPKVEQTVDIDDVARAAGLRAPE